MATSHDPPRAGEGRPVYRRREVIGAAAGGTAALALGAAFWTDLLGGDASPRRPATGYGPLRPPDQNGVKLPDIKKPDGDQPHV